jgi:hypothetical protein
MALPAVHAANPPAANPDFSETVNQTTTQLDEVIVSGGLSSLSELRKAIVDAEERFLTRYNELNKSWQHDVKCVTYQPTGTRIPVRHCEPNFIADAKRDVIVNGLHGGNLGDVAGREMTVSQWGQPELQKHMRALVESDAELQRALVERALLIERYAKVRKEKLDGQKIVWD